MIDYRELFVKAPAAGLLIGEGNIIIDASDEFLRLTNTDRETIMGRGIWEVFPANPADEEQENQRIEYQILIDNAIGNGKSGMSYRTRFDLRNAAGEYEIRYWETGMHPIFVDGRLICVYNKVVDVTNEVRKDNLIKRAVEVLYERVVDGDVV